MDDRDRARFLHDLFVFNDTNSPLNFRQPARNSQNWSSDDQFWGRQRPARQPLVRLHAFCLMDNHYHLLVSPIKENGVPAFMKKLGMGYARYFNERHGRSGALWQGKYKKKLLEQDSHFLYIPYYIHLNALDRSMPEWREGRIKNTRKALEDLRAYRWSSHLDYLGEKNFPSITEREFLSGVIGSRARYEKEILSIISSPELAAAAAVLE